MQKPLVWFLFLLKSFLKTFSTIAKNSFTKETSKLKSNTLLTNRFGFRHFGFLILYQNLFTNCDQYLRAGNPKYNKLNHKNLQWNTVLTRRFFYYALNLMFMILCFSICWAETFQRKRVCFYLWGFSSGENNVCEDAKFLNSLFTFVLVHWRSGCEMLLKDVDTFYMQKLKQSAVVCIWVFFISLFPYCSNDFWDAKPETKSSANTLDIAAALVISLARNALLEPWRKMAKIKEFKSWMNREGFSINSVW